MWGRARAHRRAVAFVAVTAMCVLEAACQPRVSERMFKGGRFGMVALLKSERTPDALVFVFSDSDGWTAAYDGVARTLAGLGAVVVGVDLPQYLRNLAASNDGCHYVIAEIEDMSERLQRDFRFARYQSPILAGIGAGGALAYAALAQSPAATIGGAISVDPAAVLGTRVPLCAGAPATAAEGGGFSYGAQPKLNGWWRVSTAQPLSPQLAAVVEQSKGVLADVQGTPLQRLPAIIRNALPFSVTAAANPLADLPLVELPVERPGPAMAVIYSGDGGWRDIDKQIGEVLSQKGMPVVGVDSLRYFWHEKMPEEIASDLSQIIRHYGAEWSTDKVVLVGYSFGACILPFAVNHLPSEDRTRIVQVSLLGLEPRAEFEVKLSGWFGGEPGSGAPPVLPEILRQNLGLFQCFYGAEEEYTLCRAPELGGAEIIRTGGGRHFGGDYRALAEKILDGAARRLNAAVGNKASPGRSASSMMLSNTPSPPGTWLLTANTCAMTCVPGAAALEHRIR